MTYASHKDIISRWPTVGTYAADLGLSENTAKQMKKRNSISADHWPAVVAAARRRGYDDITVELLLALRPARKPKLRPDKPPPASAGPLFSAPRSATG